MQRALRVLPIAACTLFVLFTSSAGLRGRASDGLPIHNLSSGKDYSTIQAAIEDASTLNGHVIRVDAGTYFERVYVMKSLTFAGESRESTVVDAGGVGYVFWISASNVSFSNFTMRYPGRNWAFPSPGYPDGCVIGVDVTNVRVENCTLNGGAACAFFGRSTSVTFTDTVVFDASYIGIGFYDTKNAIVNHCLVYEYGSDGIHLDGGCTNCTVFNNTVRDGFIGISLERSATTQNAIDGNTLARNNVSIGFYNGGLNTLRRNNMSSSPYNLLILSSDLNGFVQDIDTSNTVNGKTVYYLINNYSVLIDPDACPDLGYLALVNCTDVTAKDFTVSGGEGLLIAYSSNCTLTNLTLIGSPGILKCGGLTFYNSTANTIVGNGIANYTYGVALNHSDANVFYHNSFADNSKQAVSNYCSPFYGNTSDYFSANIWDNGYPSGGNYWSDYAGADIKKGADQVQPGSDGIGDTAYVIDSENIDRYPLKRPFGAPPLPTYFLTIEASANGTTDLPPGTYGYTVGSSLNVTATSDTGYSFDRWLLDDENRTENPLSVTIVANHTLQAFFIDDIPPDIDVPIQEPSENIAPDQNVTVTVSVKDNGSGLHNVTLWYSNDNGTSWTWSEMVEVSQDLYQGSINGESEGKQVIYKVIAYDSNGNVAVNDNNGYYYAYTVIPESTLNVLMAAFVLVTLFALVAAGNRRKRVGS